MKNNKLMYIATTVCSVAAVIALSGTLSTKTVMTAPEVKAEVTETASAGSSANRNDVTVPDSGEVIIGARRAVTPDSGKEILGARRAVTPDDEKEEQEDRNNDTRNEYDDDEIIASWESALPEETDRQNDQKGEEVTDEQEERDVEEVTDEQEERDAEESADEQEERDGEEEVVTWIVFTEEEICQPVEMEIRELLNLIRAQYGLCELKWDERLYWNAFVRAEEASRCWAHIRPDGSEWWTLDPEVMNGETLAEGQPVADRVVDQWMASPRHRAVILDPALETVAISRYIAADGNPYYAAVYGEGDR